MYSVTSGVAAMGIADDAEREHGYDTETETLQQFDEALSEIENRKEYTNGNYPFFAETNIIKLNEEVPPQIKTIYTFLLLATRENMGSKRIAADIDGALLFEKLCAVVIRNFFGEKSQSLVFGTGSGITENFQNKVERLLSELGEKGYQYRIPEYNRNREQDGKVDIVVFIPFSDKKKGQFLAFGQCKTGTSWHSSVTQMRPASFSCNYISPPFLFTPMAIFMVCESFYNNWEIISRDSGGLIFDRERIMEYLPENIDEELISQINEWNSAVIGREKK